MKSRVSDGVVYIEDRSIKIPESGCWLWEKSVNACGYGTSKHTLAHRVAYKLYKGDIPKGMQVLHTCDVPSCVNPNHLFLGTHKDNMRDRSDKGRGNWDKLNKQKACEIRGLYKQGYSQYKIADMYGVTQSNISCIVLGKTWS